MSRKTRGELRALVRTQLDMDDEELPNETIDAWLEDGFERTLMIEERWPFFEHQWNITTVADQVAYSKADLATADADSYVIAQIVALLDITDDPFLLDYVSHDWAELHFGLGANGGGVPAAWSEWAGSIHLWTAPAAGRTVRVRGYRLPAWGSAEADAPDCDERLHYSLYFYACAMAYAQQEDEILANQYLNYWSDAVRRAQDSIMAAPQRRPLIMSRGSRASSASVRLVP
jgi:hypothetical protein